MFFFWILTNKCSSTTLTSSLWCDLCLGAIAINCRYDRVGGKYKNSRTVSLLCFALPRIWYFLFGTKDVFFTCRPGIQHLIVSFVISRRNQSYGPAESWWMGGLDIISALYKHTNNWDFFPNQLIITTIISHAQTNPLSNWFIVQIKCMIY